MHLTHFLRHAADLYPDKIASIDGDRRHTWGEWRDRITRLAAALRALGMAAGDRVAILALNGDRYTEYLYAVWWAGGAVVPMNTRWSAAENAYSLNDSGAEILFIDQMFAPMLDAIRTEAKGLKTTIYMGDDDAPAGLLSYEALVAGHTPCADAMRGGEDLAGLFYTGGTTGFPKGVMLPHRALWFVTFALGVALPFDGETRWLHVAPMFHLADFGSNMSVAMLGGCNVYIPAFAPEAFLQAVETHAINSTILVPTMVSMVMAHPDFRPERLASLKNAIYGASPMAEGLLRQVLQTLPDIQFYQGYGQTELAPSISLLKPADHALDGPNTRRLRSAGRVIAGVDIKIVDEDGNIVPRGTVGEIAARSPGAMQGYWNLPGQTAKTLVDGWVHTGDGAFQDEEGYIYIVDRLKDMIVSGGENVFSAEVESAISTHPDVAGVAVIGIPSERWGEEVHAIIIPKPEATLDEAGVIAHCKALIAGYKCPRSITLRSEPFPLSGAGKVLKRDLRAPFWEGRGCNVN
jgi:acyl-CoA synthetase (AMP-forming)/AMP-acid ligase II